MNGVIDFAIISVTSSLLQASDLDVYLQSAVENVMESLRWWNDNCHVYPTLYHMALDYLSIPG